MQIYSVILNVNVRDWSMHNLYRACRCTWGSTCGCGFFLSRTVQACKLKICMCTWKGRGISISNEYHRCKWRSHSRETFRPNAIRHSLHDELLIYHQVIIDKICWLTEKIDEIQLLQKHYCRTSLRRYLYLFILLL